MKIGAKIIITNLAATIRIQAKRLSEKRSITSRDIEAMKEFCKLSEEKQYKVFDYCKTCHFVYIGISKNRSLQLRTEHVKEVK